MKYSEKTVKLIARVIEDLRNNTMKKGASFAQRYFLHKGFKKFGREGHDTLTKEMDQPYMWTFFYYLYSRLGTTVKYRGSGGYNDTGLKEHNEKTQRNNDVQWEINLRVVIKWIYF